MTKQISELLTAEEIHALRLHALWLQFSPAMRQAFAEERADYRMARSHDDLELGYSLIYFSAGWRRCIKEHAE